MKTYGSHVIKYGIVYLLGATFFYIFQQIPTLPIKKVELEESKDHGKTKNVLFIISDDLRPQLNAYRGHNYPNPASGFRMHTPNLDSLAARSLLLTEAHVQYSVCGPSRASYMTGRRPDTTQVWDLTTHWRHSGGNFTTIPQFFKQRGYQSAGVGKIYHGDSADRQDPLSWSIPWVKLKNSWWRYGDRTWTAVTKDDRTDKPLLDERILGAAKDLLRSLAPEAQTGKRPFFLAVGFTKPHLPWVCGSEFWDLYPLDKLQLIEYPHLPQGYPSAAFYPSTEFMTQEDLQKFDYKGDMNDTFPEGASRDLRRAYFACVSHVDYLVGQLLEELRRLHLHNTTVVSFIGDHGYHLGENGLWGKHTNFQYSTHAPMMIRIPGETDHGVVSSSLVEFVDIFPTLVEAAGLGTVPTCPKDSRSVELCTEGTSLMPLVTDPDLELKTSVLSQLRMFKGIDGMHYSLRTAGYRYNEVVAFNRTDRADGRYDYEILWESAPGVELYDLTIDPAETHNVAHVTKYLRRQAELSRRLHRLVESHFVTEGVTVKI